MTIYTKLSTRSPLITAYHVDAIRDTRFQSSVSIRKSLLHLLVLLRISFLSVRRIWAERSFRVSLLEVNASMTYWTLSPLVSQLSLGLDL